MIYISLNPKIKHIITLLQHLESAGMPQEVTNMHPSNKYMNLDFFFCVCVCVFHSAHQIQGWVS
jgi:hypothetical protein